MTIDEIVDASKWAVDIAEKYRVPVSKVTQFYKAMRKFHTIEETKNMIEEGFISGRACRDDGTQCQIKS